MYLLASAYRVRVTFPRHARRGVAADIRFAVSIDRIRRVGR